MKFLTWLAASALMCAVAVPALAGTFVYVSNAEDGDIGAYRLGPDGALEVLARTPAGKLVLPLAVSPDRRFLYAAVRTKPYSVHVYAIEAATGALKPMAVSPLAESFPFITLDKTGRFLLGASYGAHLVSVNAVGRDGRVAAQPLQVIPVGRNAHAIRIDATNRFVFVPTLGSDAIFEFVFDEKTGRLASNTPALALMSQSTGPRHFVFSPDNKFVYVLSELLATVTTFALDGTTGTLSELHTTPGLPSDTTLMPGAPRVPMGSSNAQPRNTDNDIWASDIHITPDGRFLYIAERTSSTLSAFAVDTQTGALTYLGSTPTEKQPRGFAIDSSGKFLVASGEQSDTISVYAIDQSNGALRLLQKYPTGKGSNWIEIVSFD
ncbi:MAG: beta-propeller fold lactonase family protein [Burkholderiales bacterium]|nr:beta-propeller fold lactonase family protein [Burkholderiales bacterium]